MINVPEPKFNGIYFYIYFKIYLFIDSEHLVFCINTPKCILFMLINLIKLFWKVDQSTNIKTIYSSDFPDRVFQNYFTVNRAIYTRKNKTRLT